MVRAEAVVMMVQYCELHAHSYYSFLDGVCSPAVMVAEAARLGVGGLALIDHDGFYGAMDTAAAAAAAGLPTVWGSEVTVDAGDRRHTGLPDPDGRHLVVLARNMDGYRRLCRAISNAQLRGGKERPRAVLADLADAHDGTWQVLTGCRKGPLAAALAAGGPAGAERELRQLQDMFGRDAVAVELWHHHDPDDDDRNDVLSAVAGRCAAPIVATTNAHYAGPDDARLAALVAAVRARRDLGTMDGWLPASPSRHLRSPDEQARRFRFWPGAVETAGELGMELAFDLGDLRPQLPAFPTPPGMSEAQWLRHLVDQLGPNRYGPRRGEHVPGAWAQLDHELAVIEQLGFAGYFLIVHDLAEFCRQEGIYAQGRGSAANSAVCFVLGITICDPVRLGLLFERFLSPERDGPPDIDLDIESGRREDVIQYLYRRHDRMHTAMVSNVNCYRPKGAIRDAARALGHSPGSADAWTTSLTMWSRSVAEVPTEAQVPAEVVHWASQLLDMPRHLAVHVGGMIITREPVAEVVPVEWATKVNRSVVQWDKDSCASAGLVKFDLLGLGMLEALHRTVDAIEALHHTTLDLGLLPQESEVYDMLCAADTVGVFQVESRAQMATLPRLKPRCFQDLVIEIALIRPGPIQGNAVHPYLKRRQGVQPPDPPHPLLTDVLSPTLGVAIFQEQLMRIAVVAGGFTAAEADELRRAMGSKRSAARMDALKGRLYDGMAARGISGEPADQIWQSMASFAEFGFPESHAQSFAAIAYASAWLKLHYPAEFLLGLLNSQPMGFYSPSTLIADAERHGVTVLPVDINTSAAEATAVRVGQQVAVRLGLTTVRGIGADHAARILAARNRLKGSFSTVDQLGSHAGLDSTAIESLATAGALTSIDGAHRRQSLWQAKHAATTTIEQLNLQFDTPPPLPAMRQDELVVADITTTGLSLNGSLMHLCRQQLEQLTITTAADLATAANGHTVTVAGIVTHRQRPETASGVTFISLEDDSGLINVICRKQVWHRHTQAVRANALVITGHVQRSQDSINVVADSLTALQLPITPPSRDFR